MNISLMAEISFTPTDKTPIVTAAPKMLRFTEAPVHRFHSLATRSHSESRAAWVLGSVIGAFRAGALPGENRSRAGLAHDRSEEHTSELQSLAYLVCRLLLEKKKNTEPIPLSTTV